jgi:hypothetical protein
MDQHGRREQHRAALAGNVMEWHDFSVYGYFAAIIGRHFVYVTTYIRQADNIAQPTALDINTVAKLVSLVLIPLLGALPDRRPQTH